MRLGLVLRNGVKRDRQTGLLAGDLGARDDEGKKQGDEITNKTLCGERGYMRDVSSACTEDGRNDVRAKWNLGDG